MRVTFNNPGVGLYDVRCSAPEVEDLRSRAGVFEELSVNGSISVNLTGAKFPERLEALVVSPNYFSMLGVAPQLGRVFDRQDFALGFAEAAIISDGLWSRSFGRDPQVLGRNIRLDNDLYNIVGVLPPGFRYPGKTIAKDVEVFLTAGLSADPFPKPSRSARAVPGGATAYLKPGVSLQQAQARLDVLATELRSEFPADYPAQAKWSILIEPLQRSLVGDVRLMLWVLMGAVGLIILIASVNVANLLLARASGRQREIAVRLALGASRGRIVRQLLTESMILALLAGVAGALTATGTLGFILRLVPTKIPRLSEVGIDWTVLGFALLTSILTGIVFGLAPALQSVKIDFSTAIKEGAKGAGYSKKTGRLRDLLIISELALAMVLMVGAGLLLRTFWHLLQQDLGFNPSNVVVASIWLPRPNDPKLDPYIGAASRAAFVREILQRVATIPGIELVGLTSDLPGAPPAISATLTIEDRPIESLQNLTVEVINVSPDYFKVMQSPLVRGRFFSNTDEKGQPEVAIIDEAMAYRYWPNQDPTGRRLRLGQDANLPWLIIVGVIKNIKHDGLDRDGVPHIYASIFQRPGRVLSVVSRTSLPASSLEAQIRHEIEAVDPALPIFNLRALDEVLAVSLAPRRFSAQLVGAFAALALLLASIGIYGLLTYMVGQRSQEIGIRMALGARPVEVLKLILGKGVMLAGAGILIGLLFAAIAASMIASLLYGVRPIDPMVFLTVPLLLFAVTLLASYVPAYRATKVDPMIALRQG